MLLVILLKINLILNLLFYMQTHHARLRKLQGDNSMMNVLNLILLIQLNLIHLYGCFNVMYFKNPSLASPT